MTGSRDELAAGWPPALRAQRAYLPFRYVPRASGRRGKRPCSAAGVWVDPGDRRHHLTFAEVLGTLEAGAVDGVGLVLGDHLSVEGRPLVGIDLDGVVEGGQLHPGAAALLKRMDTYAEVSVSGGGLHLLALGTLPAGVRRGTAGGMSVELITRGYLTLTGRRWPGAPSTLCDATDALGVLHRALQPPPAPPVARPVATLGDTAVLARARSARNGARFCALYDAGDLSGHAHDPSRADLALLSMLRWFTTDPDQLRRLWAGSALHRPERWARPARRDGTDYATATLDRALSLGGSGAGSSFHQEIP